MWDSNCQTLGRRGRRFTSRPWRPPLFGYLWEFEKGTWNILFNLGCDVYNIDSWSQCKADIGRKSQNPQPNQDTRLRATVESEHLKTNIMCCKRHYVFIPNACFPNDTIPTSRYPESSISRIPNDWKLVICTKSPWSGPRYTPFGSGCELG